MEHTEEKDLEIAMHYLKTFSDTAREPFLVLRKDLRVLGANESFYSNFKVTKSETEERLVYELGDGQWNIPELKILLEGILPEKKVFNDFEVSHKFPKIGKKIILLNARQLDDTKLILLAIEDITLKRAIETKLATYIKDLEESVTLNVIKTRELEARVKELAELNKIMVGRELKMIEMKKELKELKSKE